MGTFIKITFFFFFFLRCWAQPQMSGRLSKHSRISNNNVRARNSLSVFSLFSLQWYCYSCCTCKTSGEQLDQELRHDWSRCCTIGEKKEGSYTIKCWSWIFLIPLRSTFLWLTALTRKWVKYYLFKLIWVII